MLSLDLMLSGVAKLEDLYLNLGKKNYKRELRNWLPNLSDHSDENSAPYFLKSATVSTFLKLQNTLR
jgi:hypothetical protein